MNNAHRMYLRTIGDVYLPGKFADVVSTDAPLKLFGPKELNQLNRIFKHLHKGGIAVTSGSWDKILEIFDYLERKKHEFATLRSPAKEERRNPVYRKRSDHWYERHYQRVLSHIMVIAQDDRLPYVEPDIHIQYLSQLLGEPSGANDGLPFLIPVSAIQKIESDMKKTHYVSALEADIVAHSNVLQPLSQDTVELLEGSLQKIEQSVGPPRKNLKILDMGCGCGVLSLLAAKVFGDHNIRITATDILPEAIATTKINVQRFADMSKLAASATIETTDGGDLFEPVGNRRFDLIIFNAPWVVSEPQSRAEMAICDAGQSTVRRFLHECPQRLEQDGRVVLSYSDHSGLEALENLESMIEEAGLKIENASKMRVQTRSQKHKWEAIIVYTLVSSPHAHQRGGSS
ncbi:Rossmann-like fold-containing protein [Candidatus Poribacteria bacterium]